MNNEQIKSTLALIMRSPDVGGGWRNVSGACWPLLDNMPGELVEIEPNPDEIGGRARVTDEGRAVRTYSHT